MRKNEKLRSLNPCKDGLKYAESFDSLQKAWDACERGDWMLWLLGKLSGPRGLESRKELVLIACKCARTALKYVKKGEKRPLKAIQTAEKWIKGKATTEEVRIAADAADAAYAAAYAAADAAYAAADAAYAAAYAAYAAAYAAAAAATAAYAAAYAAATAAYAADAAAYADAAAQKKCANIIRKMHPKAPRIICKEKRK